MNEKYGRRKVDDEPLLGMEFEGIYKGVFEMPQTANERDVLSRQQFMQFQTPWKKEPMEENVERDIWTGG